MTGGLEKIKIVFPDGTEALTDKESSLKDLADKYQDRYASKIVAAKADNDIKELSHKLKGDCRVQFIDLTKSDGIRIYQRSLTFVMIKAFHDLYPNWKVKIYHSLSKQGLYCEIDDNIKPDKDILEKIKVRMGRIIKNRIPFEKKTVPMEKARKYFKQAGRMDRYHAIEHRLKPHVTLYECDGFSDYFYGYMAPDTGYVDKFNLILYSPGFVLMHPQKNDPLNIPEFEEQKKLFFIFEEYKNWSKILDVENMGSLNKIIKSGNVCELVRIAEALHEKKIAQIADMITKNRKRLVFIAGPSSSGKTTFAHRLSVQLRVNGLKPVTISLDDYYRNRENAPVDEQGKPDFESLEAIDVELFNNHIYVLTKGQKSEIPIFDFPSGKRKERGRVLKIDDNNILIVEGIHGLNENISRNVPGESKFKIYVSALTSLNIDDHNRIPSTDTRLIRRIVRDNQFRGMHASGTIKMWASVRRGEKKWIFPYQETADVMFNSSLKYELGVLKTKAEPLLKEITKSEQEYSEAKRLLELLGYFLPVKCDEIPINSILREFTGGNCFYSE